MATNVLQILADRAAKSPKLQEMYKKEKEKYSKELNKRENGQQARASQRMLQRVQESQEGCECEMREMQGEGTDKSDESRILLHEQDL